MKQFLTATFISVSMLAAQPAIQPPQLGFVSAGDGSIHPAYGVAGNFILGPSVAQNAISQAFSGSLGLLKAGSSLTAFDSQGHVLATTAADSGPALFAFSSDGLTALAYIASTNTLLEWSAGKFSVLPFRPESSPSDTILSIARPNTFEASLIVERADGLWEVRLPFTRTRAPSQKALTGITAPAFELATGELIFSDEKGIVLRNADGSEVHLAAQLPAQFSLQQMGASWVELTGANSARRLAIRLTPGHEAIYQLPEAGQ